MRRYFHIYLALFCSFLYSCEHGRSPSGRYSKDETARIHTLMEEVNRCFESEQPERARVILDSIAPVIQASGDQSLMSTFLRFNGSYYELLGETDSALHYFKLALKNARERDTAQHEVIAAKMQLISFFKEQQQYDSALLYAREAYDFLAHSPANKHLFAVTCLRMGEIYLLSGNLDRAARFLRQGWNSAANPGLRLVLGSNLCSYYDGRGYYDSSLAFFEQHMLPDTGVLGPDQRSMLLQNYAVLLMKCKRVDESIPIYRQAIRMRGELGDPSADLYFNLGVAFKKKGHYATSLHYLDTALTMSKEAPANPKTLPKMIASLSEVYHLLGQDTRAYNLMDSAYGLKEDLADSSFLVMARELEAKYSMQSKDNEIRNLAAANAAARRITTQQRFLLIGLMLLLGLSGLLIFTWARRRQVNMQLRQTELEQRLLRSQMEPHFIFNTLSVLQGHIRSYENEKAVRYLNQFARLLRVSLEHSRESFVPLPEEIESLGNYLSLQAMRFEDKFGYSIDIYEGFESDNVSIPPMLLQPFVENAIQHGLYGINRHGEIKIGIRKKGRSLICRIIDNGIGLREDGEHKRKGSLATIITRERLSILGRQMKIPATLSVRNNDAGMPGTTVELVVPYQ